MKRRVLLGRPPFTAPSGAHLSAPHPPNFHRRRLSVGPNRSFTSPSSVWECIHLNCFGAIIALPEGSVKTFSALVHKSPFSAGRQSRPAQLFSQTRAVPLKKAGKRPQAPAGGNSHAQGKCEQREIAGRKALPTPPMPSYSAPWKKVKLLSQASFRPLRPQKATAPARPRLFPPSRRPGRRTPLPSLGEFPGRA